MVKLIDGLEARGYVERVRNPADRRAYALHATPAGVASMSEMLPRMARAEAELTANLSSAEHERLNALLRPLIEPPPPMLADRTGFLLARAHHASTRRPTRCWRRSDIQIRQFGVLTRIADGTCLPARARRPPAGQRRRSWSSWSTRWRPRAWSSAGATPRTAA